ncbi:uncharacterized protein LOC131954602 [Physella acuta]|uniref:uncharacterized protein LOC131954602 n=1 Tax=Physella acuta TaxID=109671 RepID=UPI0027DB0780|nr:uncharacterized protein LOC131954602 [Physella acuta]
MLLIILALSMFCGCQVAADDMYKSIVPKLVKQGEPYVIYCDPFLAGVPEKSPGVLNLELKYKNYFAKIDLKGFHKNLPPGWVGFQEGMYGGKNGDGLYGTSAIRIKVVVEQAKDTESGQVCCGSGYEFFGSKEYIQECQEVKVSNKALVDLSTPGVGKTVNVLCQADFVVDIETSDLDYVMLAWANQDVNQHSYIEYSMSADEPNQTSSLVTASKPYWSYTHTGTDVNSQRRFNKKRATLGITISKVELEDSGFFCCGVIYYDPDDARNYEHRCQYMHVATCEVLPEIENGFWVQPCDAQDGCYFRCHDGFVLTGIDSASCHSQGSAIYWTEHGQCVNATLCDEPPSIENGTLMSPCFPVVGSVCHVACNEGYIVNGAKSISCNKMVTLNEWSSPGQCIPTVSTCGELPPLTFGQWEPACNKTVGSVCHPVCDKGYVVHGATQVTCNEQLQWSISGVCDFPMKTITKPNVIEGETFKVDCSADLAGVAASVLGVHKLEIFWRNGRGAMEVNGYHMFQGTYYHGGKAKPHWTFTKEGTLLINEFMWLDRRQFKVQITITNSRIEDSGRFCCDCMYYDSNQHLQASMRCQEVLVSNKSMLVQSSAIIGHPVKVVCDADLSGVPKETKGLEYLELTWRNEDHQRLPLSVFKEYVNILEATHTVRNIMLPSSEHNWSINSTMARLHPHTLNLDRNSITVELIIGDFKTDDVGMFCCSASYMDMLDEGHLTYGCQSLSMGIVFSSNGFCNVQASNYLIFLSIAGILKFYL